MVINVVHSAWTTSCLANRGVPCAGVTVFDLAARVAAITIIYVAIITTLYTIEAAVSALEDTARITAVTVEVIVKA